eukprot:scpid86451/ scgid14809/ 1-(5-phosphoribosyl)-5-[(5-phosphoribosylamino)methylideneamino] imidazole-4-carboxamide isomerase; 5-proFAR isomerase; Phosphoribosylformimino-5-aminoimidazole carboxamide ribotide isomerase
MPTLFRPCIDLHNGQVKQIVGGTLDSAEQDLKTNFVSSHGPVYFAELYRKDQLVGGHVIKLGGGNDEAARSALAAWPNGLQVGGGINADNAMHWLEAGASKVIVTSWLFPDASFSEERLKQLSQLVTPQRLVVDISCRRRGDSWLVATNKWQTVTQFELSKESMSLLASYCSEFLVHAADVEGLCSGIDEQLVKALGEWSSIPCTYAGGAKALSDLDLVNRLSEGKVDLTIGSALDIFGGDKVKFEDCVQWNIQQQTSSCSS